MQNGCCCCRHPRPRLHTPATAATAAWNFCDRAGAAARLATMTLGLLAANAVLPLTAAVSTGQCRSDAQSLLSEMEYQGFATTLGCARAEPWEVCSIATARGPCTKIIECDRSIAVEGKCTAGNEGESCCLVPLAADPVCFNHICGARPTGDCVQICGGGGLGGAAIAGLIIGAVFLGAVVAAAAGVCYCRRNLKRRAAAPALEVPLVRFGPPPEPV